MNLYFLGTLLALNQMETFADSGWQILGRASILITSMLLRICRCASISNTSFGFTFLLCNMVSTRSIQNLYLFPFPSSTAHWCTSQSDPYRTGMEWSRLPGEAVHFILGILTAQQDRTLRNLVWSQRWFCSSQQDEAAPPEVPSHLKLPCGPWFWVTAEVWGLCFSAHSLHKAVPWSKSPSPL